MRAQRAFCHVGVHSLAPAKMYLHSSQTGIAQNQLKQWYQRLTVLNILTVQVVICAIFIARRALCSDNMSAFM